MKNLTKIFLIISGIILMIFILPVQATPVNSPVIPAPVLLWSASTGSTEIMSDNAAKVSISGDGKYVAAGYAAGIVEFRDRQGAVLWKWQSPRHYYTVWQIAVSRNGEYTGVVLYDPLQNNMGELDYFDRAGKLLWSKPLKDPFGFASVSENGSVVALSDSDRISFFTATGLPIGTTVLEGFPWAMEIAKDGSSVTAAMVTRGYGNLYVISANGTILWGSPTGPRRLAVANSADGRYLAGTDSGTLRYFTRGGAQLWSYTSAPEFTGVAVSSDGSYVAASSQYYLRYFNSSGVKLWQYEAPNLPTKPGPYLGHLTMSDDGGYLSVSTDGNRTLFFNQEGKLLWQNDSPQPVESSSLSGNGKYLALGTEQEFRFFDTGIDVPLVEPAPTVVATTVTRAPVPSQTRQAPVPGILVIVSIVIGILGHTAYRKK